MIILQDLIYKWKRFWCARSGSINLSDNGYLYDPDSNWGSLYNPHVVSWKSISKAPCLVLLGEPGIGKTNAMNEAEKSFQREQNTLFVDLRSCGSETSLYRNLFEHPTFISWLHSDNDLHLFLDSLDECLLRIDFIIPLLINELKRCPTHRLFLRISCRTAEWPNMFEKELIQIWGKENLEVFELAPLRRKDVEEAVETNGLNVENFMMEVQEKEVISFVIKPVTLNFLLNLYKMDGKLPSTQLELYLRGCELLCEETNENRIASRKKGQLSIREKLTVASRIAAIIIFSNKYAIWKSIDLGNVPQEDITLQELSYGRERKLHDKLVIDETALEETLSTGLFTSRGVNRLGWAHQTYAEFLAALYIIENELSIVQIMDLIKHPEDTEEKLVPQLYEVSAWLATMNTDIFHEIVKREPQVLLRSDVATVNAEDKSILVDGLLKHYEEEKIIDWDYEIKRRYFKLAHPNLANQLRPYILDENKGLIVRRGAILIAASCKLTQLLEALLDIALNPTETLQIRVKAARFVGELGEEEDKAKLAPLAKSEIGDDSYDDLKGIALQALWPQLITVEELFSLLTPPKRNNYLGPYKVFLTDTLLNYLEESHLPFALKWIKKQPSLHRLEEPYNEIINEILKKSWSNLDDSEILNSFAEAILSRLEYYDNLSFFDELRNVEEKKKSLLLAILGLREKPEDIVRVLSYSPIFNEKDLTWMTDCLLNTQSKKEEQMWAQLIWDNFSTSIPHQVELVYKASRANKYLADLLGEFFEPVKLNSTRAKEAKQTYLKRKKIQERIIKRSSSAPTVQRIKAYLDKFESGNLDVWWQLNWYLSINSHGNQLNELESDLTSLFGWEIADSQTRERIINAAKTYILEKEMDSQEWFGTNDIYRPAYGGFRALRLLLQYDTKFILSLSQEMWKKWIKAIMNYPVTTGSDSEQYRNKLVELSYAYIPDEIIEALLYLIDKENREDKYLFIINSVENCWDDRLTNALLFKVKDNNLKNEFIDSILHKLLEHNVEGAIEFAKSLVQCPLPIEQNQRSKSVIAARELLIRANVEEWNEIWSIIEKNPKFGHEIMLSIATNLRGYGNISQLKEKKVADLYIWLVQQFPYEEDPNYDNEVMAHFVGTREKVGDFRDFLLRLLRDKGTFAACEEIKRTIKELPNVSWLKWTLLEAQSITRRYTWTPPRPVDIIKLATNKSNRFVQSGEQLLNVLIDSLQRLEQKLYGETPAVFLLWNHLGKEKYKPKTENEFSDYVKQHLEEDLREKGIIVNREVEIRRTFGTNKGERTDIQVNAVINGRVPDEYQTISAIIEIKGNWHRELNEAMETQLADRYLKENTCKFGLYLVGWFSSESWEDENRKRSVPKISVEEAQNRFNLQAKTISNDKRIVKAYTMNIKL